MRRLPAGYRIAAASYIPITVEPRLGGGILPLMSILCTVLRCWIADVVV